VATDHQHCYDDYHVPDGVPDSEHAKSRRQSSSFEIGRTDSSNQRRTQCKLVDLEDLSDEELKKLAEQFRRTRAQAEE